MVVPDLDVERIVEVALAVCDDRGADGLTMRAVADELGVTPMALYRHVKDKTDLVGLLFEAVLHEEPLPAPTRATCRVCLLISSLTETLRPKGCASAISPHG